MSDESKKKRARRGGGSLFQKGQNWGVQYYRPNPETGKSERKREYTAQPKRAVAHRLLTERLAQINRGENFGVGRRTTVGMLFDALRIYIQRTTTVELAL